MQLNALDFTETQQRTLEKKGIISTEAFLRKNPLHYYDFSEPLSLSLMDKKTTAKLQSNAPFAIIGMCETFTLEQKDHMQMAKMRVRDEKSTEVLFVNVMSSEALKITLLEQDINNAVNHPVKIPSNIKTRVPMQAGLVNASCIKQIIALNEARSVTAISLGKLKTGGLDRVSKMQMAKIKEVVPDNLCNFVMDFFVQSSAALSCLRWIVRGLEADIAIRKTMCDTTVLRDLLYGKRLIVGGFIHYNEQYKSWSILNPAIISSKIEKYKTMNVRYSQMKGFTPSEYASYVDCAIEHISGFEIVPDELLRKANLPSLRKTAQLMHHPKSWADVKLAKKRCLFDDLLYLAVKLKLNAPEQTDVVSPAMSKTALMDEYISSLPYSLTNGQKCAIDQISEKMKNGRQAIALVQGDVGTGKTCVAFALMMQAVENGYQAALAVPYTTLANQHFRDIEKALEGTGYKAVLLTSEASVTERAKAKKKIESGEVNIVVGTHSIFAKTVEYQNLGLIIEDEEHKFGVVHREDFSSKGVGGCHRITMSATPIPKSLAGTLYGDGMDIITITDKPANRLPVKTAITDSDQKAANLILREVKAGHQAYIVCPAIEQNDKSNINASIEVNEKIYKQFFSGVNAKKPNGNNPTMVVLTGKTRAVDKIKIMEGFADGEIDILMSTTVIEVGMNVPNATVMVITGADRFGFSTLHQLRGRVGRGSVQSYCVLKTEQPNEKLAFMQQCTDGFEIAEKDLEMRGPGSLFGEKQTGDNYFISLMLTYPNMYKSIKEIADDVCKTETGKEIVRRYEEIYLAEELR